MKLSPNTKYLSRIGAVALSGLMMAGTANAVDFTASATVQNALTVTNVAEMNLGTLFATTAADDAYKYITLAPDGTMGIALGAASVTLLGLGGQSAAQASVTVGNTTPFTVTLPTAEIADGATTSLEDTGAIGTVITAIGAVTDVIEVRLTDPAVARFQLVNFTVGSVTGGTPTAAECADITDDAVTCSLTPDFGATEVGFSIGATIVTDVSGTRTSYEAGDYTGTFTVTASY